MSTEMLDPFLDVDFTKDPRFVLGDITPPGELFGDVRGYGDVFQEVPEDDWEKEVEKLDADGGGMERLVVNIFNQGREGSCVANACSQAHQIVQAKQWGKELTIKLSAMSLYKRIGSSAQSGAMVSNGLKEMRTRGILPLDTPENKAKFKHTHPATGFNVRLPDGWEETGKLFLTLEWFELRGINQLISALLKGKPVVVGRAGHSICYCRPRFVNGVLRVNYANSWDYDWGIPLGDMKGGFGTDSLSYIKSSAQWAFCPNVVVDYRAAA